MKNQSFKRLVVMVPVLMAITSGAPISSQKSASVTKPDSAPPARIAAVDSVSVTPTDSLLKVAHEKADKVSDVMDKVGKRGDRIINKLQNLENRQAKIRLLLTPVQVEWYPKSLPPKELEANPESPEIKPVEVHKTRWWKRAFGHD